MSKYSEFPFHLKSKKKKKQVVSKSFRRVLCFKDLTNPFVQNQHKNSSKLMISFQIIKL